MLTFTSGVLIQSVWLFCWPPPCLVGGFKFQPLWKIWVCHLEWWTSQLNGKISHSCSSHHQQDNIYYIGILYYHYTDYSCSSHHQPAVDSCCILFKSVCAKPGIIWPSHKRLPPTVLSSAAMPWPNRLCSVGFHGSIYYLCEAAGICSDCESGPWIPGRWYIKYIYIYVLCILYI